MRGFNAFRGGRRLSTQEADMWAQVADTVTPLEKRRPAAPPVATTTEPPPAMPPPRRIKGRVPPPLPAPPPPAPARPVDRAGFQQGGLDGGWDRRLAKGAIVPDFTLDLHGATLDTAYVRLDHGLTLALAQGARVVLLITGRPRPHDAADRGTMRGAIRAKFMDWLTYGSHASRIAAVRSAAPRHGGAGAVYIILRRAKG